MEDEGEEVICWIILVASWMPYLLTAASSDYPKYQRDHVSLISSGLAMKKEKDGITLIASKSLAT